MLKKKSNLICYHAVRESVAMGEMLTGHVPSKLSLADLLTQVLFGSLRRTLCSTVHMADISDPSNLPAMLLSKVRVSAMTGTIGTKQGREVDAPTLAKRWCIPLDKTTNTRRRKTQRGV